MATTRPSRTIKKPSRFEDGDDSALEEVPTLVVPPSTEKKRVAGIMQRRGAKLLTSQDLPPPPPPPKSKKIALGSSSSHNNSAVTNEEVVVKEEEEEMEEAVPIKEDPFYPVEDAQPKKKARTTTKKAAKSAEDVPAGPKPKKAATSKKKDVAMTNAKLFEEVADRSVEEQLNAWKFAISKCKGEELKVLCKENNLMVKGSKIEIVERLSKSRLHGSPPPCDDCGWPKLEFKYHDTQKEPYTLMSLPYKIVCKHVRGPDDKCGNSVNLCTGYYCSDSDYQNIFAQPFRDADKILASKDIPGRSSPFPYPQLSYSTYFACQVSLIPLSLTLFYIRLMMTLRCTLQYAYSLSTSN